MNDTWTEDAIKLRQRLVDVLDVLKHLHADHHVELSLTKGQCGCVTLCQLNAAAAAVAQLRQTLLGRSEHRRAAVAALEA